MGHTQLDPALTASASANRVRGDRRVFLVGAVANGPAAYQRFLDVTANPVMILINLITLAFVLLHAVTFANLTPRAMVVRLRGRTVPSRAILAGVYLGWLVVTAFLAWLVVG